MQTRRALIQGVLSLAALGPLGVRLSTEEPEPTPLQVFNAYMDKHGPRRIQAGPRISFTLVRCDDGEWRTPEEIQALA